MTIATKDEALAYHAIWNRIVAINEVTPGRVPVPQLSKIGGTAFDQPLPVVEMLVDAAIAAFTGAAYAIPGGVLPPTPTGRERQRLDAASRRKHVAMQRMSKRGLTKPGGRNLR